jgi:acyl-coenzyme A thioesterase PaaI-like protein
MKVSFLQPATVGVLWGRGRVVNRGRSIAFVEGDLTDDGGRLLARASATARIIATDSRANPRA